MAYISNSPDDQREMLKRIGVSSLEELFSPIPESLRLRRLLDIPEALSEPELTRHIAELAERNKSSSLSFTGGGIYNHYVPAVIWTLVMRPEFATAYTPYQAEVAQGTLQVIYEFQSHLCRLTGMDVANASMYDGATAMAEAALLAVSATGRKRIVVSETVSPLYREVLKTHCSGLELEVITVSTKETTTDFDAVGKYVDDTAACLILGQPNFFGYLEELERGESLIHKAGGLFITVADPISLGILKTPAEYGVDICVGEGQSLGIPQNFGGPLLGFFTCRQDFIRRLPGRLAARTVDTDSKEGFVLTLQTREQHIRREKATSNICTNQALCATAATVYLSLLGKKGLPRVARLCTERAHYLAEETSKADDYSIWSDAPFFKEFIIRTPVPPEKILKEMSGIGIAAGIDLGRFYPDLKNHLLVAVTETVTFEDCDRFVAGLKALAAGDKPAEVTAELK
jgi:glycine dehydrogenase subunit 1